MNLIEDPFSGPDWIFGLEEIAKLLKISISTVRRFAAPSFYPRLPIADTHRGWASQRTALNAWQHNFMFLRTATGRRRGKLKRTRPRP